MPESRNGEESLSWGLPFAFAGNWERAEYERLLATPRERLAELIIQQRRTLVAQEKQLERWRLK